MDNWLKSVLTVMTMFLSIAAKAGDNLPNLGSDVKPENSYVPLVLGAVAAVAVMQAWKPGTHLPCRDYPCADVGHFATGAAVGYIVAKHYDAKTAYATMFLISVGKEGMDKYHGKRFGARDVFGRMLGVPVGLYFVKELP